MADGSPLELEHFIGFSGKNVRTLCFHKLYKNITIQAIGSTVIVGDLTDPHKQLFLRAHDEEVLAIDVSAQGRLIASGQRHRKNGQAPIYIWDFSTGKMVYELNAHSGDVKYLSFSSDEKFLASVAEDNRLCIWDLSTGQLSGGSRNEKPAGFVTWGRLEDPTARRPKYTLVAGFPNQVKVFSWQYDVRAMQFALTGEACNSGRAAGFLRTYHDASVDKTNTFCFAATASGEMLVYNIRNLVYRTSFSVSSNGLHSLVLSDDFIYCGSGDGKVKKIRGSDIEWAVVGETQLDGKVVSLSLSSTGTELIAGTSSGKIYKIAVGDMSFQELSESHIGPVLNCSFGTRTDMFSTISADGTARVWDLSDYIVLTNARSPCAGNCIIFAEDNTVLLSGWEDGFIRSFDARTGKLSWQIVNAHRGKVTALCSTKEFIVSGGQDCVVRVWSAKTRELVTQFTQHSMPVQCILQDNRYPFIVHSCSQDKSVYTYDLRTGKNVTYHNVKEGGLTCMSQLRDGEHEVVTGTTDGKMIFWDLDLPSPVLIMQDSRRLRIHCVSVSPSGRYMAVSGESNAISVYRVSDIIPSATSGPSSRLPTGRPGLPKVAAVPEMLAESVVVAVGVSHSSEVFSVQWSPDEKQLVSVGADSAVCIWNFYGDH